MFYSSNREFEAVPLSASQPIAANRDEPLGLRGLVGKGVESHLFTLFLS
jgi:hypothetical protein